MQEDDHTGSDQCDGVGCKSGRSLPADECVAEFGPKDHALLGAKPIDAGVLYGSSLMMNSSMEAKKTPGFEPLELSEVNTSNMESAENFQNFVTKLEDNVCQGTEREGQVDNEVYEEQNAIGNATTTEVKISEEVGNSVDTVDLHRLGQVLEDVHEEGHGYINCLEDVKQQLYLSNVVKEFFHLQLSEQIKVQMESDSLNQHLIHEVLNLQVLIKEVEDSKKSISEELVWCRSEMNNIVAEKGKLENLYLVAKQEIQDLGAEACKLQDKLEKSQEEIDQVLAVNEELNTKLLSGKGEIYGLNNSVNELQHQLEMSERETKHLTTEMADCNASLGTLQLENANLSDAIVSAMEERKKLEGEKTYFVSENKKLEALLFEQKENFTAALNKQIQLESDLQKAMVFLEHLTEENFYFSNSLDLHKAKVKEFDDMYQELLSEHRSGDYQKESSRESVAVSNKPVKNSPTAMENYSGSAIAEESLDHGPVPVSALQQEISDDTMALIFLKVQLEDAEKMLQRLEKEIQGMHSHSASLSGPGKVGSHGVSRLIQTFELKAHTDEIGQEEGSSSEVVATDSFKLAQAQISGLRDTLKKFELGLESLHKMFTEEKNNSRVALRELGEEYECQKQQKIHHQTKNSELLQKVAQYETRIGDLLNQFDKVHSNADQEAATMLDQLESLQKEVNEKISVLMHDWQSFVVVVSEEVEKLNTCVRLFVAPSLSVSTNSDVATHLASAVDTATQAIESLHLKLEAAYLDQERIHNSYTELDQKFSGMNRRSEEGFSLIDKIYRNLRELVVNSFGKVEEYEFDLNAEELLDFQSNKFEMLIQDLQKLVDERKDLLHSRDELISELMSRNKDIEEVKEKCFNLAVKLEENEEKNTHVGDMMRLVEDIEDTIQLDDRVMEAEMPPLLRLEAVVICLLQKHKDAIEQVRLSKTYLREVLTRTELPSDYWKGQLHTLVQEEFGYLVKEVDRLQGELFHFTASNLQKDEEIHFLKDSIGKMEEAIKVARSEVHAKVTDLEQSEQKLASVREKLGIAVAKGKGLITQRDSLKQSFSEKCSELEKCLLELQSKDAKLHEIESRLKASESGERVEALESELSYIRNSAAALRESFLLKDSILQRIEEVLEDLDLPDQFHSRDIIEKVEWLARSLGGNSIPLVEWDQKSSVGGSYSDAGFIVMDNWREDPQNSLSQPGLDDLKRKYDELESKFYGLAEHNEMLEQSLMERNNLLQRWEEVLDHINVPLHLRSMEPEDRLEWLGRALAETQQERDSYLIKIEDLETSSQSLISESKELHEKISDLKDTLVNVSNEKELLFEKLEKLVKEHKKLLEKAAQSENELDNFHRQVADLHERLVEKHQQYSHVESEIMRLQGLVSDALPVHDIEEPSSCENRSESFERLLRKLISNYTSLTLEKSMPANIKALLIEEADADSEVKTVKNAPESSWQESLTLKEELAAPSGNLALVMEERERALERCQSLALEVDSISKQRNDLQELLNQEEQKSATVREKLNVAVRKGKGLVQQRDSLKLTIEEMSAELSKMKLELNQKIKDVMTLSDKLLAVESENSSLRNSLERSEQEEKRSKRAAELLATELDEVHERIDILNEEQAKADAKIAELSVRIEQAEAVKEEALSNFLQFKKQQHVKLMELVTVMDHLRKACSGFGNLLGAVFSKDVEFLYNVEASLVSCLKQTNSNTMTRFLVHSSSASLVDEVKFPDVSTLMELKPKDGTFMTDLFAAVGCGLQECIKVVDLMIEKCEKFVTAFDGQAAQLPKIIEAIAGEVSLHKEAMESFKRDTTRLQTLLMEKNAEVSLLHGSISLLYEACAGSIMEIENKKVCDTGVTLKFPVLPGGKDSGSEDMVSWTEDFIRTVADTLSLSVKTLISKIEVSNEKELKTTILNLQKEIQEKDIQGNRICAELVNQIKEAEATAKNYLVDLQSAKAQAQRLEEQVELMKSEQDFLQTRVNELNNQETASKELPAKVDSLSDIIAAKDQEIEALMQALDEEESQMESLTSRIEELETTIQQKNLAVENLEASRGNALKKYSTTVGKFNELRQLSENLLSEIENLHTQLQGRDEEISFLRQKVTRCTKDLLVSQESGKGYSSEMFELLSWLEMMALRFGVQGIHVGDQMGSQIRAYTEILEKNITSTISKLDDLRSVAQSRDVLLQTERSKVEELVSQRDLLESSLREKKFQLEMIQGIHESGQLSDINTVETLEVEPLRNKRATTLGPLTHVRSGRKVNSDQIAVRMDIESGDGTLVDEDDDKAHGFKSLVTSRIVPRFTRSIADRIDGLWVSGERMLMREPTLRLGVVIYWILLHGLLAAYVV
ncbi:trans-Golgi network-localized SYP41-interacting protein 1-like isoform X3 [Aristolochia californica]|uniref:trans-Golgi network-localized SYP41-interacting protein 1-like isoform X3 n=1 Tax=Aristolochia californica TaxID=171875 RepID=UPI0035DDB377